MSRNQKVYHGSNGNPTEVWLYETNVLNFTDTDIRLYAGQWRTATTRKCINKASSDFNLGIKVSQKNYAWFVHTADKVIPFADDMIISRGRA